MNSDPISQLKIYGLKNYFNEIKNLFVLKKLPNKILLNGPKGSGKSTLAFHIINYIFSINESDSYDFNSNNIMTNNKSFKLIQNGTHPNFYQIDLAEDKKNIEISQVRKMIEYSNLTTFSNSPKLILINNLENLNINSANALLKVIEEPNNNVFFILINNSNKNLLETLKSRCLIFNIKLTFVESIKITNNLLNDNIFNLLNIDLINYYNTPGDYINLINFAKKNNIDLNSFNLKSFLFYLIDKNFYKKDDFIKNNIFHYIELYFLKIYSKSVYKKTIFNFYTNFVHKINNTHKYNLDFESLFIEFRSNVLDG